MLELAGIVLESMKEQAIVWRWPARRVWSKVQATKGRVFQIRGRLHLKIPQVSQIVDGR